MRHLTTSDEATRTQITELFKDYSIKSSSTEEIITDVVDLLKSLSDTLYSLKNDTFPDNFVDMVATIFTTTSVPEFNQMLQSVLQQSQAVRLQDAIGFGFQVNILGENNPLQNTKQSVDWIFKYINVSYRNFVQNGTWDSNIAATSGQSTLTNPVTQPVPINPDSNNYISKIKCFNCNGVEDRDPHHHLQNCPFPKNQARIQANREKQR